LYRHFFQDGLFLAVNGGGAMMSGHLLMDDIEDE
jgi:hypothetical protein